MPSEPSMTSPTRAVLEVATTISAARRVGLGSIGVELITGSAPGEPPHLRLGLPGGEVYVFRVEPGVRQDAYPVPSNEDVQEMLPKSEMLANAASPLTDAVVTVRGGVVEDVLVRTHLRHLNVTIVDYDAMEDVQATLLGTDDPGLFTDQELDALSDRHATALASVLQSYVSVL